MAERKINLWILHAGLGHKSPYFHNLIKGLKKYKNLNIIVSPDLPKEKVGENNVLYFNRLKRYYKNNDKDNIDNFLNKIDKLKTMGWKIVFTLHNFFPLNNQINNYDYYLLTNFLAKMDCIFTFSNVMKSSLLNNFNKKSICHGIGVNNLKVFKNKIKLPQIPKNHFVYTFIGNISEYKMLECVIKSFESLKKDNTTLILAGPNSNGYNLDCQEYKNIIRINEFVGKNLWDKLIKKTDIFINTYDIYAECFKYGFFPSNCISILNAKKVCIAPNCQEIKELIPEKYFLSYDYDYEIKQIMEYAFDNRKFIKSLERTFPKIKHKWSYTVKIIAENINKLFNGKL